jgi:hypothetical protein
MIRRAFALAVFSLAATAPALAQPDGNVVPTIDIIRWVVNDGVVSTVVFDAVAGIGVRSDVDNYIHLEGNQIIAALRIRDGDWTTGDGGMNTDNEAVFFRFRAFSDLSFAPPEAPPITTATDLFQPEEGEGFRPPEGTALLDFVFRFDVPQFPGRSQRRLRGLQPADVRYVLQFQITNEQMPEDAELFFCQNEQVGCDGVLFLVNENPALSPANPQAFADAGADRSVVRGSQIILDGTRTFDSSNQGFDPLDPDIFDEDSITFVWEWISGPVRVDPVQTAANDPLASVTLNQNGTYVFRLTVDDNASDSLPTTDSVTITVVDSLPSNDPPTASITGPASAVPIGTTIKLDASATVDPDGDTLRFRWRQVNSIGGPLDAVDLLRAFQPLSGIDTSISTWQAVSAGTFYFRLLVDDGDFLSTANFTVIVSGNSTNGQTLEAGDAGQSANDAPNDAAATPSAVSGACGLGLTPLAVAPLALLALRRRR